MADLEMEAAAGFHFRGGTNVGDDLIFRHFVAFLDFQRRGVGIDSVIVISVIQYQGATDTRDFTDPSHTPGENGAHRLAGGGAEAHASIADDPLGSFVAFGDEFAAHGGGKTALLLKK